MEATRFVSAEGTRGRKLMLLGRLIKQDWGRSILLGTLGAMCVVVPVANLLVPEDSAFHVSTYTVTLLGKYL